MGARSNRIAVPPGLSLTRFLCLIEELGETPVHAHTFVERLGAPTVEQLISAGFLVPAGFRTTYHCGGEPGGGCSRRVAYDGADRTLPLIAHCGASPPRCSVLRLADGDASALSISLSAIEGSLAEILRLRDRPASERGHLVKLGEQQRRRGWTREVFVAWRPGDPEVAALLAERGRKWPRWLVLVPTTAELPTDFVFRYRRSRHIELAVLAELVSMKGGRIVRRPTAATRGAPHRKKWKRAVLPPPPRISLPKPATWNNLELHCIDDETAIVRVGEEEVTASYSDLGMASELTGEPKEVWETLRTVCADHGWFTGRVGQAAKEEDEWTVERIRQNDKVRLTRLRDALKTAFGIEDDPFRPHRSRQGWRARFVASPERPKPRKGVPG